MSQLRRVVRDLWRAANKSPPALAARSPAFFQPPLGPAWSSVPSRFDEWAILQNLESQESRRLLKEEAAGAERFFSDAHHFEDVLQHEAACLIMPEEQAPPERHGSFWYYQRHTPEGFVVFCRRSVEGGSEEVILDSSQLAHESGTRFADVTACKVSDGHNVLAYIVDFNGDESYELRFRTLGADTTANSDQDWSQRLYNIRSVEFLGSGDASKGVDILVVHTDVATRRACSISQLRVAEAGVTDDGPHTLWQEHNEAAYLELFRTKDRRFVLLSSNTKDTSEVRVVKCHANRELARAPCDPQLLLPRTTGVEYFAEHQHGDFYVVSNHERPDFAVYRMPAHEVESGAATWQMLQPFFSPPGAMHVTDADMFTKWLVLYGHEAAAPRICVVSLGDTSLSAATGEVTHYLAELPFSVGSVDPGVNAESAAELVRFNFRSPLEPGACFDLHLSTGKLDLIDRREWTPGTGIGPGDFLCSRVEFPTADGELVPMTLLRPHPDAPKPPVAGGCVGSERPCLLHVYGAYGSCLLPDFRPENIALLRRGWVIAWAHVRGGGECGRRWHSVARQLSKGKTVRDLADAVRFLIARGVAAPNAVCLKAASAGGFPLGALLNSPKEAALIAASVLEVPFVDVLTGMSDPSLPLTVHEFEEWGDPREPVHAENLMSLSPYENVGSHRYSPLYLSGALVDARVPPWMPLKFAARIRARAAGYIGKDIERARKRRTETSTTDASQPEVLPCVVVHVADGGHGGAADWHGRSEEFSRQIVFLYKALGLPLQ